MNEEYVWIIIPNNKGMNDREGARKNNNHTDSCQLTPKRKEEKNKSNKCEYNVHQCE